MLHKCPTMFCRQDILTISEPEVGSDPNSHILFNRRSEAFWEIETLHGEISVQAEDLRPEYDLLCNASPRTQRFSMPLETQETRGNGSYLQHSCTVIKVLAPGEIIPKQLYAWYWMPEDSTTIQLFFSN